MTSTVLSKPTAVRAASLHPPAEQGDLAQRVRIENGRGNRTRAEKSRSSITGCAIAIGSARPVRRAQHHVLPVIAGDREGRRCCLSSYRLCLL